MKPIDGAVHLCVDMQRLFARGGVWETPWMERVLPTIAEIVERYAARTVFTRFVTQPTPEAAPGQWRPYFERWKSATRQSLDDRQLGLVPELARYAPPAMVVDKPTYSAFFRSRLAQPRSGSRGEGMGTIRPDGVFFDTCPPENMMADEDLNELFMDTFGDSRIHYAVAA